MNTRTVSALLHSAMGSLDASQGPPDAQPGHCWLCGVQAGRTYPRSRYRKPTFSDDDHAASPDSDRLCPACAWCLDAYKRLRSRAIVVTADQAVLMTRGEIKPHLLAPPDPPFAILIPTSFQLHLFYRARMAYDRGRFPVQFERQTLTIDRAAFAGLLGHVEALRALGHTVGEITAGQLRYRTLKLHGDVDGALAHSRALDPWRRTGEFGLALHVSHGPSRKEATAGSGD